MKDAGATDLERRAVNTLRFLAVDMVERARSGHPGLPLGAAPMLYVLFQRHLRFDPSAPDWPDRDRFVLSAGHGSALLYAALHLYGYDLSLDDLRAFRSFGSRTPGHPEFGHTPGVEATTGPLGQGTANSVGMAVAERMLRHRFGSDVVDHRTYALVSDGDLMEGIAHEAASLAGHWRLGKLTWLYDSNDVTLDGPASLSFSEDVPRRFEALGWHVLRVEEGDEDLEAIDGALRAAVEEEERPTLIVVRTTIGYGSPHKAGTAKAHGSPLGEEEARATKRALGWPHEEPFFVPEEVRVHAAEAARRGRGAHEGWRGRFDAFAAADPDRAATWRAAWEGRLPDGLEEALPSFEAGSAVATRAASGKALNALAARVPWLVGGDADLSGSTKTRLEGEEDFDGRTGAGRNLRFGVREHAMGAIANGIAYHGGLRPYTATFFVFSDYMRPPIRLAALSGLPVVFVFTHDSIAVGEDGPTHEPVEQLAALRAVPGLRVVRPADAQETAWAWLFALRRASAPTALVLTRQGVETLDRSRLGAADGLLRGGYVLASEGTPPARVVIVATGSEVGLALAARTELEERGIATRVVSMPCVEEFLELDEAERREIVPPDADLLVAIEAGVSLGWRRIVGTEGLLVTVDRFGASAPGGENLERYGFAPARVTAAVCERLAASRAPRSQR